ncbi:hypothetical protein H7H78_11730 [Mycobacterium shinjukuense]|uniref:Uncharacterized protein n=1 Tax=Mycobacterium shinjukuense TaxID=398694 RepID=A0A7I7MIU2_9MYCO|nr:hypothetical protein [Mycobacterium shinjukuense]MCV6986077.1 hypothetical protein [Mycobacterium shinjukuense]ORB70076.1 hypothetical protein BST45_07290 [Mycobacterium shinjukuense]BBX72274.1 hypothetical protein MSHI_01800 [Mycobacterium shinjukuense]
MIDAAAVDPLPDGPDPDYGFWSQTDELAHIHSFARARRVAPYAVLGCVLRRATACIEPHVVLPPVVGGHVSANFFTLSTGASGQGKGAADAAGTAAVRFHDDMGNDLDAERPSLGSGEGLARLFKGAKDTPGLTRAHLVVPEVKTLEALTGRQGATLVGELLKAFVGEPVGFHNAQHDTSTAIRAHSYRLCLGVGAQPENAEFFLARAKDGLPQRFLWLPTVDPYAPEGRPDPVDPLGVLIPTFSHNCCDERHVVQIPDSAREEIDVHRYRVLIGDPDVDPLDGHLMLTQLKTAFAIAVLHGRNAIDETDWKIAGDLTDVSIRVRDQMRAAVDAARRRQNAARARDRAERETIVAARLADQAQRRVVKAVCGKLRRRGRATRSELRVACAASIRSEFDGVFEMMVDEEIIVISESTGKRFAPEYTFGPKYDGGL